MDSGTKVNWLKVLQYTVLLSVILYVGKNLFIPLSFALLLSFVLYPVCKWLEKKGLPRWSAIFVCLLCWLVVISGLAWLLVRQVIALADDWPTIQAKFVNSWYNLSHYLEKNYGFDTTTQVSWLESMASDAASTIFGMAKQIVYTSAVSMVLVVLIPLYVALILYNREQLANALFAFFPVAEYQIIKAILHETITTYYNFIKGMAMVYLVVAILNCVGLMLLGIPHAIFFGVVASILTFIPYIGITIGALLPIVIAWISFDSVWYPLGVVIVFAIVQYLEANLIFPWAVSYRLQVNMLFTLLAIVAGGILWAASGMILFVPFLAILKLIADKHKELGAVSLLLGHKDDIRVRKKMD